MSASEPTRVRRHPEDIEDDDELAVEEPLEIRVEGRPLAVLMRTPGHDEELVAGFLWTEGVIDGRDDLAALARVRPPRDPTDNVIDTRMAAGVRLDEGRFELAKRAMFASSSCGVCGKATIENVLREVPPLRDPLRATAELLLPLPAQMREVQAAFSRTGGLHAAALFTPEGRLEVLREDVGRHNAVDKVLGWRLLQDRTPADDAILLVSGRAGFEIVQKALVARVPVLAAVGAPSSLAVRLAREGGMQLVGFLREGRFNRYAP